MKFKVLLFLAFLFSFNAISAQSIFDKWTVLKEFHTVMSETFHPSEEGNLEPIKTRSLELVTKAEALLKSEIPEEYRTNAILTSAEKLQTKSKLLHKMILANSSNETITKSLSELHDVFHEIVGLCSEKKQ